MGSAAQAGRVGYGVSAVGGSREGSVPACPCPGSAALAGWAMAAATRLRKAWIVAAATRCKIARSSPAPGIPAAAGGSGEREQGGLLPGWCQRDVGVQGREQPAARPAGFPPQRQLRRAGRAGSNPGRDPGCSAAGTARAAGQPRWRRPPHAVRCADQPALPGRRLRPSGLLRVCGDPGSLDVGCPHWRYGDLLHRRYGDSLHRRYVDRLDRR